MIDMCCKFEQGFKKDSGSETTITRKMLHKKKAIKSKGTCFHCGKDECWKKKYRGLTGSKTLCNGEMIIRVGNGTKISAKAIGTYMLKLPSGEGLFHLETSSGMHCIESGNTSKPKRAREEVNREKMWNLKLGHVNLDKIRKMSKDGYFRPLGNDQMGTCECCLKGKMTKSPFTGKGERATKILGLIHTDVCGPMSTTSRGGFSYYITFTDDHSRFGYVYLMKYNVRIL
ncbi:hypothetical protein COP2_013824 [Malus domestica]